MSLHRARTLHLSRCPEATDGENRAFFFCDLGSAAGQDAMRHRGVQVTNEPKPIAIAFPLRGEWEAEHTPADRVPSHGTDQLGQRYAYDFVRIERSSKGMRFFRGPMFKYLLSGVRLEDCYGWSAPIFAPFSGTVVSAKDHWSERRRLHLLSDLAIVIKNALSFDPSRTNDLTPILGNHIILKMLGQEVHALFAHARDGSIQVREGEEVKVGDKLAEVGHSGNSTAPHLHFQLMDRANIVEAKGLPCCFKEYEMLENDAWHKIVDGIPPKRVIVRYIE